jgi:anti-sigma B factor antagonist
MILPDARYLRTTFNGVTVIRAPADIDITTADQLRTALLETAAGEHPMVVVDMTRTAFCDSSGLHTLLRARNRLVTDGGDLHLVIPADGVVARILAVTGLDMVISCYLSLAEAMAGLAAFRQDQHDRNLPRRSLEPGWGRSR